MSAPLPSPADAPGWAFAEGDVVQPVREAPESLIDGIEARLRHWPDGELWTYDDQGDAHGAPYAELWARSLAIYAGMQKVGVAPGRIVTLLAHDALAFTAAFWACLRSGCVILPLTRRPRHGAADAAGDILGRLPSPLILADDTSLGLSQELAVRLGATAMSLDELERAVSESPSPVGRMSDTGPACLIPTSGSTGRVKLALLPEEVLIRRRFVRFGVVPPPYTRDLVAFDLDTVTGMNAAFLHTQTHVQIPPAVVARRPLVIMDAFERHGVTMASLTCSLAGLLAHALAGADRTWDVSRLRRVGLGAERVDPLVATRLADALARHGGEGIDFLAGYGATETSALVTGATIPRAASVSEAAKPLCLGGVAPGVKLRVVDEAGRPVREREVGLVEAQAPGLTFAGYWADEAATKAAFTDDGWWRSGDLGALEDGRLWIHGRAKDVIVARGRKHALNDIDSRLQAVLAEFPIGAHGGARALSCALQRPGEATEQLGIVVFADDRPPTGEIEPLTRALRRATALEFGLNPAAIAFAATSELPLGAGGKVVRGRLAEFACAVRSEAPEASGEAPAAGSLATLWRHVLGRSTLLRPGTDFFELGGDSLASEQLFAGVEAWFGRRISPEAFFARPTFGHMQELLAREPAEPDRPPPDGAPWRLPAELRDKLLTRLETWRGERPTSDRLMAGLNVEGQRPPLFWVFQGGQEFVALGKALGEDQPLYGFRSGHLVFSYTEDQIQQIALRYVHDVLETCPEGPLFLGGNCQGGVIALAMAQHLIRRRRTPALLVLMEWGFELQPYPGEVLFLHGVDSLQGHPRLRHRDPERAWRRLLGSYDVEPIPGAHGGYFWPGNVEGLAGLLARRFERALATPAEGPCLRPEDSILELKAPPAIMSPGQGAPLDVDVRNAGRRSWAGAEAIGLALGNYWIGAGGVVERWVDARTPLPPLAPEESGRLRLDISAPMRPGRYTLVVDIVEEGNIWLDRTRTRAPSFEVTVERAWTPDG